jgi:hypothetical protein
LVSEIIVGHVCVPVFKLALVSCGCGVDLRHKHGATVSFSHLVCLGSWRRPFFSHEDVVVIHTLVDLDRFSLYSMEMTFMALGLFAYVLPILYFWQLDHVRVDSMGQVACI